MIKFEELTPEQTMVEEGDPPATAWDVYFAAAVNAYLASMSNEGAIAAGEELADKMLEVKLGGQ